MTGLQNLIDAAGGIISYLIGLVVALSLLVFLWGLVKFLFHVSGDEKAVEEGKNIMFWGVIALFVMTSVWGLVWFLNDSFGIPQTILNR